MKKFLALLLACIMVLSLCACKSKELRDVENLIDSIGEVTLESAPAIEAAEEAYEGLSEENQRACGNYNVLTDAREKYDALVEENQKIKAVEDAIAAIGEVTIDSLPAINAAQAAYDALDNEKKAKVSNASVLVDAIEMYNVVKEENKKTTLESLTSIKKEDRNMTFYYPDTISFNSNGSWVADVRSFFLPYIGKNDDGVWMCSIANYTQKEWIFFNEVTVNVDGESYPFSYDYFDVTRDNANDKVWEYVDAVMTESDIEMFRKIAASTETIVSFNGDSKDEFIVSAEDKAAIAEVLAAYDAHKQ